MIPLLQVVTAELPAVPSELDGVDVVQVFVGQDLPVHTPVFGGPGFAVLGFTAGELEPRDSPFDYACPRPFQIRWSAGRPEGPSWDDASRFLTHELTMEYVKTPDCFEAYYDRYAPCHSTKVGGWPAYIQGAPELLEGFVLQIASEEKPRWMLGDNGNLYFYRRGSEWGVHGDCYQASEPGPAETRSSGPQDPPALEGGTPTPSQGTRRRRGDAPAKPRRR
jgi:hypothetical protein